MNKNRKVTAYECAFCEDREGCPIHEAFIKDADEKPV
jgi:hypothetical protein